MANFATVYQDIQTADKMCSSEHKAFCSTEAIVNGKDRKRRTLSPARSEDEAAESLRKRQRVTDDGISHKPGVNITTSLNKKMDDEVSRKRRLSPESSESLGAPKRQRCEDGHRESLGHGTASKPLQSCQPLPEGPCRKRVASSQASSLRPTKRPRTQGEDSPRLAAAKAVSPRQSNSGGQKQESRAAVSHASLTPCVHEAPRRPAKGSRRRPRRCCCSLEERRAFTVLRKVGIRGLTRREVAAMTDTECRPLGAGSYGSCCQSRDPHTGRALVIKTFAEDAMDDLLNEAKNLHDLQHVAGVQRLVGVCVKNRQLVSGFAGPTADSFFKTPAPLADAASVFLQVSRTLQAMLAAGYCHNDLKGNNVCVNLHGGGPVATVIDLGLATPVGTWGVYYSTDPQRLPWVGPELLLHTQSCGEASDVYGLARLIQRALGLKGARALTCPPTLAPLAAWLQAARSPEPSARPGLAALIQVLEALCEAPFGHGEEPDPDSSSSGSYSPATPS